MLETASAPAAAASPGPRGLHALLLAVLSGAWGGAELLADSMAAAATVPGSCALLVAVLLAGNTAAVAPVPGSCALLVAVLAEVPAAAADFGSAGAHALPAAGLFTISDSGLLPAGEAAPSCSSLLEYSTEVAAAGM